MSRNPLVHDEPQSDEELLASIRAGELGHFGELIRRYERELYGYLRRYLGSDDLASDVFQTTFIAVFKKIHHYQPGRAARPWLYTIATNQAIDALRQRKRRRDHRSDALYHNGDDDGDAGTRGITELIYDHNPGPPSQAETEELRASVRDAIDQLPDLLREVILLSYFQGLKYNEISDVLGIPLGTVKSRLHSAIARLTEVWQETMQVQDTETAGD